MSASYRFRAEPRALAATKKAPNGGTSTTSTATAGKAAYREESKECLNIMHDPRVVRGSNFSQTRRSETTWNTTIVAPNRQDQQQRQQIATHMKDQSALPKSFQPELVHSGAQLSYFQQPLSSTISSNNRSVAHPMFIRPETPTPVEGRSHFSVQTDPIYEDLRPNPFRKLPISTQTDTELDYEPPPLFNPKSSGADISTGMESPEGIPDFDRDVEMILDAICSEALEKGLIEVCEEEEKEILQYKHECEQKMQLEINKVQSLVNQQQRQDREKQRRMQQEKDRIQQQEADAESRLQAALETRKRLADLEAARIDAAANWVNPAQVEVEELFIPWLTGQVQHQIGQTNEGIQALDTSIISAIYSIAQEREDVRDVRKQEEFDAYVLARYTTQPAPKTSIATKIEKTIQEETQSRQRLNRQAYRPIVEPDAEARAQFLIAERERAIATEAKYQRDIIRIQSQVRARRDRRRADQLKARRDLLEQRKSMNEKTLIYTLNAQLGMTLEELKSEETTTTTTTTITDNSHSNTSHKESSAVEEKPEPNFPVQADADTIMRTDASASLSTSSFQALSLLVVDTSASNVSPSPRSGLLSPSSINRSPRQAVSVPYPAQGLRITKIKKQGAASQAGLLQQDVITHINNELLSTIDRYKAILSQHHAGDVLSLTVYRSSGRRVDNLNIECYCDEEEQYPIQRVRSLREAADLPVHDAPLHDVESALAEVEKIPIKLGFTVIKSKTSGVLVSKVMSGSLASSAGLCDGDLIIKVDRRTVESLDEWKEIGKTWKVGDSIKLDIQRQAPDAVDKDKDTPLVKLILEVGGGGGKKTTVEWIRALRLIAGLKVVK